MKEATDVRAKEKAENLATIKDAKESKEAVDSALAILRDFYDKQALLQEKKEADALLQIEKQVPEMKAYKGQGGSSKGVVGMLEVILADFARVEAETTADEKTA